MQLLIICHPDKCSTNREDFRLTYVLTSLTAFLYFCNKILTSGRDTTDIYKMPKMLITNFSPGLHNILHLIMAPRIKSTTTNS
jgi:hypothetical protein